MLCERGCSLPFSSKHGHSKTLYRGRLLVSKLWREVEWCLGEEARQYDHMVEEASHQCLKLKWAEAIQQPAELGWS